MNDGQKNNKLVWQSGLRHGDPEVTPMESTHMAAAHPVLVLQLHALAR